MAKRLLALLLTLVMVLQPVLPAAAEAVGEDIEVTEATEVTEETVEVTEGVTEETTEEPTEEVTEEATEEPTEEATEEVTEEATATEETFPQDEVSEIEENDAASVVKSGSCGPHATYSLTSDGVFTVSGSGKMDIYEKSTDRPWNSLTDKIKKIVIKGDIEEVGGFQNCLYATTLDLSEATNLKVIYRSGFYNGGFYSVYLPSTITNIGEDAFHSCDHLSYVQFYGGANGEECDIAGSAFMSCTSLSQVILSDNVVSIGESAFNYCPLRSVTIPASVQYIGDSAFAHTSSLSSITLSEGLESMGDAAFYECSITEITIPASLKKCGLRTAPFCNCTSLRRVTFAEGTTEILPLFKGCSSIQRVNIPDTVTSIRDGVFKDSTSLKQIYIPKNVTSIGANAIPTGTKYYYAGTKEQWSNVTRGTGNSNATVYYSHVHDYSKQLSDGSGGRIYACDCGSYTHNEPAPKPVNTITASNISLYTDSTKAQTVALNASALGGAVLSYRSDNASVTVSTGGTVTVAKGFSGTAKITITAAETSVYKQTTAVITVQVISAGNVMDSGDYGTLHWELRESGTFALSGSGSMAYSESGYPWQRHVISDIKSIIIENGVTSIATDAFWGCSALESLILGSTVQEIGEYAFFGSALKEITIPASVRSVADSALNTATLQNIYVESGNSTYCDVDGVLFTKNKDTLILFPQGRTGSYSVPSTVRTLAQAAFISSQLTQVQIPEGVTEIELACFASSQLARVTLPSTLRTVGVNAFMFCSKLKSITIPGSVKSIGSSAFEKAGLEKVTIENGVTTIGEDAFISCPMMSVTLPASVASIGEHAIGYTYQSRAYQKIDGFMIYGTPGSAAQQYATSNGFTFESTSTPISNTITASNITLTTDSTRAQTVSLNASALGGAALSYQSDNTSVTVSSSGTVTVAKGFVGTAKITITAAATSAYKQTTKTITVTVKANVETAATIKVESQSALTGKSLTVPVLLTKNSGIAGFGLTVNYDESVLTLNSITAGSAISGNGTFSTNGNITTWYTVDNTTVTGELMQLNFTVKEDAPEGDTEVTVALTDGLDSNLSDEDGNPVSVTITAGKITVTRGILGDVNGDGSVAIADVVLLNRSVLGKVTLTDTAKKLGDVNGDGNISIADVVKLNRYVLKKITALAAPAGSHTDSVADFNAGPAFISVGTVDGKAGQTVTVPVSISGNPGIAGYSLKVDFDTNALTLNSMTVGSLITGNGTFSVNNEAHIVNWYTVDNMTGNGELLKLSFTVKEGAAEGTIPVSVSLNDGLDSNLSNEDGIAVPVTISSGGVRIAKAQSGTFGTLTWKLTDDGTLTISGSGEMEYASSYPWEAYKDTVRKVVVENGVTSIGEGAFDYFEVLEEVVFSDTVETIEDSAFYMCNALKTVRIPKSVTSFSESAFTLCENIQNYFVDSGNSTYCDIDGVLYNKQKDTLICFPVGRTGTYTVPSGVKTLGREAFFASKITEVIFPNSLKTIEAWCFGNSKISQLNITGNVTDIGEGSFTGCIELKNVTIPGNVRSIQKEAFHDCFYLEQVSLEEGVTAIGDMAFLDCKALARITVPSTVTSIGQYAFGYNETYILDEYEKVAGFTIVGLEGSAAQEYADSNGFQFEKIPMLSTYMLTYKNVDGATNPNPNTADKDKTLTLKDATRTGYLFGGWYKEDSFKTKVTSIPAGNEADVTLYAKWTPISYTVSFDANGGTGSIAKKNFSYDLSAALPDSGVSRTGYTLSGWNSAKDGSGTAYTPGKSVRNLSSTQGSTLTLYAQWQPITYRVAYDANGGEGTPEGQQVHYGEAFRLPGADSVTRELYSLAGWVVSGETKVYQPGEEVKDLAATEGATVTLLAQWSPNFGEIGELQWGMYNDGTLIIAGTGKMPDFSSQDAAPWAKASVTGVAIGEGVTYIGKHAFSGCTNLTTVAFPTTVEGIGESAFSGCVNLKSADTYESVQAIGKDAFRGCTSLRRVVLPATLRSIGKGAFQDCTSLVAYYYLGSLAQWGQVTYDPAEDPVDAGYVLYWGDNGEFAYMNGYCGASAQWRLLPNGTLRISGTGDATTPVDTTKTPWWSASDVTSAIVEEGIARIGGDLFLNCAAMTTVNLPRSLTAIGTGTFAGCTGLKTVRYSGKQEQWDAITIYKGNEALTNAALLLSTYIITYVNTEGAENPNPVTADKEQALVLQNPKRTGYIFDGWYKDANFQTKMTSIPAGNEEDVTLYAKWFRRAYLVYFHSNSGTGKMDGQLLWYDQEEPLSKNKFTRKGYTFAGWSLIPGEEAAMFQDEERVLNLADGDTVYSVDLYAQWTPIEYSLILDTNGGIGAPEKAILRYGTPYTLPTAQEVRKDGFALTGWTGKIGSSKKTYKPGAELKDLTTVEGTEFTLTAQWGPCKYTVRFEPGEGTGKAKTQAMTYGKAAALTTNGFKRPGYTFDGWLAEDGTAYGNKESVMNLTAEPNGVVTLTAQWRPVAYRIVFDVNGGTGEVPGSGGYYTCGVTYTIPQSDLTRQGYRFMGWSTKKNGSVTYKEGDTVKDLATTEGKAVTLYAVWQAERYQLHFDANGGTGSTTPMLDLTSGKTVTLRANSFRKPGYKFTGWNTEPDGSGTAYKDKAKVKLNVDSGMVVLYAQWEQIHYTVTYKNVPVGSEGGNPSTYTIEEGLQLKDGFVRGMTFEGWYLDAKFKTRFDGIAPGGDARNVTVYAKLSGNAGQYNIYFHGNDSLATGETKNMYDLRCDKTYALSANTYKCKGYKFLGWSSDPDAAVPEFTDKQKIGNLQYTRIHKPFGETSSTTIYILDLYAIWEPIQYTITYKGVTAKELQETGNVTTYIYLEGFRPNNPVRPGCEFDDWYMDAGFKKYFEKLDVSLNPRNITLYAKWSGTPVKYTIAYNGNGATSGSMKAQSTSCGKEVALTKNAFKRPGYTFLGWSTDPKATEPEFTNKQKVSNLRSTGGTVTLYAVWETIPYTVTLKNIGGAAVPGVQNGVLEYTAAGRDLPIPVLPGAKFAGWYTTANFKDGTQLKELKAGATGNKILYAKWQIQ